MFEHRVKQEGAFLAFVDLHRQLVAVDCRSSGGEICSDPASVRRIRGGIWYQSHWYEMVTPLLLRSPGEPSVVFLPFRRALLAPRAREAD